MWMHQVSVPAVPGLASPLLIALCAPCLSPTHSLPHYPLSCPPPSRAHAHRERRLAQQDAKRQKLRQDLERKEREGEKTRSEEEQARARLKVGEVEE